MRVTFDTRAAARAWLSDQERALRGGSWIDPRLATESVGGFAEDRLASRTDLAPRSIEFYRAALDHWILPKIGTVALAHLNPAKVSAWRSECLREARERAATPAPPKTNPFRTWAIAAGLDVAPTGRLPRAVTEAWEHAGSPKPDGRTHGGDGSATVAAAHRVLKTIMAAADSRPVRPSGDYTRQSPVSTGWGYPGHIQEHFRGAS